MTTHFIGDTGTTIQLDAGVDISGADTVAIKYKKPNRVTGTWTASADTQYAEYVTTSGVLDVVGQWKVQVYVENLDGWTGHGAIATFDVAAPLT